MHVKELQFGRWGVVEWGGGIIESYPTQWEARRALRRMLGY